MLTLGAGRAPGPRLADPAPRRRPRAAGGRARRASSRSPPWSRGSAFAFWFVIVRGPARPRSRRGDAALPRLLPAVRGAAAGGVQPRAARAPRRGAGPRAGRGAAARPRLARLARAAAPGDRQRRDVRAAARGQRLPRPGAAALRERSPRATAPSPARSSPATAPASCCAPPARRCSRRGGEVAVAWPGWGPLPRLVREAGGQPVPVALGPAARADADALLAAAGPRHARRGAVLAQRPDGRHGRRRRGPAPPAPRSCPAATWILLDAALADFASRRRTDLARWPASSSALLVVRSFSKAHAMAGFRAGYAVGPAGASELLARLAPALGRLRPRPGGDGVGGRERRSATSPAAAPPPRASASGSRAALAGTPLAFPLGHGPARLAVLAPTTTGPALAAAPRRRGASSSRPARPGATTATSASRCATARRPTASPAAPRRRSLSA